MARRLTWSDSLLMDTQEKKKPRAVVHTAVGDPPTEPGRREYASPKLSEYGSLSQLTNFGGSGSADMLGMQDGMGM